MQRTTTESESGKTAAGNHSKKLRSMSSQGTRFQFSLSLVLILLIPVLTLLYISAQKHYAGGFLSGGSDDLPLLIAVAIMGLGLLLLIKYPITIIRLRKYLEEIAAGDLPMEIKFSVPEDDITAIEEYMNQILGRLKTKVIEMEDSQALLQQQLNRAQRMESIGKLAAGIAHEINTPVQFVGDNIQFLERAMADLRQIVEAYRTHLSAVASPDVLENVTALEQKIDLPFLMEEIPGAISQSMEGLAHVAAITQRIKEFAYMAHDGNQTEADMNEAVKSAIIVTHNEWKYAADIETQLDPALPQVLCSPGDLKQVLINLIVNASQAIMPAKEDNGKGRITISTTFDSGTALLTVTDTGPGIPPAVQEHIYEPYYTTKGPEQGSGQGLSISRSLIEKTHRGNLSFNTAVGVGTTFEVRLPLCGSPEQGHHEFKHA